MLYRQPFAVILQQRRESIVLILINYDNLKCLICLRKKRFQKSFYLQCAPAGGNYERNHLHPHFSTATPHKPVSPMEVTRT